MPGDCCDCGACCFSDSDEYVVVTPSDRERLGPSFEEAAHQIGETYYLRMKEGHCAQLQFAEGDWICAIYAKRPSACRELERGSPPCLVERQLKRLRVLRAAARHRQ